MRQISEKVTVISLFEVGDLLQYNNIPLENFIIVNLYKIVALSKIYKQLFPTCEKIPDIIHEEPRSCLFDMNGLKTDVIYSTARPIICQQCRSVMEESQLPQGFLISICKELKAIRKPRYYRLQDWIKRRPFWSLFIMFIGAVVVEILANIFYEFISQIWKQ